MDRETIIILIIVAVTLFIWVPAIILSVRKVLRQDKKKIKKNSNVVNKA